MQNEFVQVLLELNGCLLIGYVLYYVLFRKNNRHSWNRIFLIGWPMLSLLIATAQINWTVWKTVEPTAVSTETMEELPAFAFEEIAITSLGPETAVSQSSVAKQATLLGFWQQNWRYFYGIGVFSMALLFLFRLGYLRYLIVYSTAVRKGRYTLLEHPKFQSIFSFGPYIFNPKGKAIHPMILEHELVHVRQRHSLDLLWMELLVIFNWFNPIIYLYRKNLKETHEFIADQSVVQQYGLLEYARLLVSQATQQQSPALGTPFAAFTKKRILTMKTKKDHRWSRLRYGVVLPLFLILLTAFAIKKVERQRPAQYKSEALVEVAPEAAAQVKWGDLTCDCFTSNLKGAYFCDIKVVSREKLTELARQVPQVSLNGEKKSLLTSARNYSATIYKSNEKRIGTPVEFADGFFTPDDHFWKKLEPGDKIKFMATLAQGHVIEFPIALEGTHPEKIIQSYLENEHGEVVPFDNISFEGKLKMTVEEFEEFSKQTFSLMENGKKLNVPISINSTQSYYGSKGYYGMSEVDNSRYNSFTIEDLSLFSYVTPGEDLVISFRPQEKKVNPGLNNYIYKLRIKILGDHPIYKQNPSIKWNGIQMEGTNFYIPADKIAEFRNTLPEFYINGGKLIGDRTSLFARAMREGNRPLDKYMVKYNLADLQKLINRRLDRLEEEVKRNRNSSKIRMFSTISLIGIETSDGHLFPFEIRIEEEQTAYDPNFKKSLEQQLPYFSLPIPIKEIEKTSSGFGQRIHPITKKEQHHRGVDLVAPTGTLINTAAIGEVIEVSRDKDDYGNKIVIQHAEGYRTLYAHLQSIAVKEGERLRPGQHIGTVGNTGKSLTAHLHFEIHKDKKPVDPAQYIPNLEPKD